jgi:carboxyl-terminal processing protease
MGRALAHVALSIVVTACASAPPAAPDERLVASAIAAIRENHWADRGEAELRRACEQGREQAHASPPDAASAAGTQACLVAMLALLGDEAGVLDRRAMAGTGIEFAEGDGPPRILRVIAGSPAQRAGLHAGDVVDAIDAAPTRRMPRGQVARLLLGPQGSDVRLSWREAGGTAAREAVVTREEIVPSGRAQWRRGAGDITWVRFTHFGVDAPGELARAIEASSAAGPIGTLFLDLRGNDGGLLVAGVALAAAFLPASATVVEFRGRVAGANLKLSADRGQGFRGEADPLAQWRPLLQSVALAVWIDGRTGGGAAIAAAALQDHRRAIVVGAPSASSDAVTTLLALPASDTILKVPTARWRRPSGGALPVRPSLAIELDEATVPGDEILATLTEAMRIMAQPTGGAPRPARGHNENGRER